MSVESVFTHRAERASTPTATPLFGALSAFVLAAFASALPLAAHADATTDAVAQVRDRWERITYRLPADQHVRQLQDLADAAHQVTDANPGRAEPLIWEGIVVSSLAAAKGGLGALSLAKQARERYEAAIRIDGDALEGSAYNSLGVLYYKVPGWPIGFGDRKKADQLLARALKVNPSGIDPNYFYADYLVETGRAGDALPYLERALAAPPRPGREIADEGRRAEAKALLEKAQSLR